MEGDIGLCVERAPDFFALNALEGDTWRVAVVDGEEGRPIGCVALAERMAYLGGKPTRTMYVSDLKVLPAYRGTGAADALTEYARDLCVQRGGEDIPTFLTILAGNDAMERRLSGPRGLPHLHRFGTIRSHSVPLLWRRKASTPTALTLARGRAEDIDEMAALWQRVAPTRQFAAAHDAASFAAWIESAPALEPSSYLLARDRTGALTGFIGLWDQHSFKQLVVTGYSRRLKVVRAAFNALASLFGATKLPPPGAALRFVTAVHICVPGASPEVLRALVLRAYADLRGKGYSFLNIGLAVDDPLSSALEGLLAQPTDVWACMGTVSGPYRGPDVTDRPVHHEIALV